MRISILWSSLASYSCVFFLELARKGCQLQLIYQPPSRQAPYNQFDLSFCDMATEDDVSLRPRLLDLVANFKPDCILMSSWGFSHYMAVCRQLRQRGVFVVATMDNQWHWTLKQCLGVLSASWFLKPCIDTLFVTGDRQAYFAHLLGYTDVLYGLHSAETGRFVCQMPINQRPASFLFIGRLVPEKGVQELLAAYQAYRARVAQPWDLKIAGTGPLAAQCAGVPGVEALGFVQPQDLPALMEQARAFILPSLFEPWGVVIHEAAAAGLPIIASTPCGATTWYVRDGVNGRIVPPTVPALAQAMQEVSLHSPLQLTQMSQVSTTLASLWNPALQAEYFIHRISLLLNRPFIKPS